MSAVHTSTPLLDERRGSKQVVDQSGNSSDSNNDSSEDNGDDNSGEENKSEGKGSEGESSEEDSTSEESSSDDNDDDDSDIGELLSGQNWEIDAQVALNTEDPEIINRCLHQLVEDQAKLRPDAMAISAWDAKFTYAQLNHSANLLAHHLLQTSSIQPDEFVHVCFEKSAWHFVSIIAINKAGAAWVPLDPSHPAQRQLQVVQQTRATLALTSPTNAHIFSSMDHIEVVQVTADLD